MCVMTRRNNLPKQQLLLRTLRLESGRQGIRGILKSTATTLMRSQWTGFLGLEAT